MKPNAQDGMLGQAASGSRRASRVPVDQVQEKEVQIAEIDGSRTKLSSNVNDSRASVDAFPDSVRVLFTFCNR